MNTLKYFLNLSDESLIMLANYNWEDLEAICYILTLNLHFFSGEKDLD